MKRSCWIHILALVVGLAAYLAVYHHVTSRTKTTTKDGLPELLWLKTEFGMGDAEYQRVVQLHAQYQPECAVMCRQIEAINQHLMHLLEQTNTVTPEIEQALKEAARIRVECQVKMLNHFYAVSQSMPADQGRRYLHWVQSQTLLPTYTHTAPGSNTPTSTPHHGH